MSVLHNHHPRLSVPALRPLRVLLGQLGAKGDCLYATAVARQIKEDYSGCHLTWAVGSMARDVVEGNPYVDEIWEFPVKDQSEMLGAWEQFECTALERQRRGEFDEIFLTQINPNNFGNYDGTVRTSIFRGYPRPITVPVTPIIRLNPAEVDKVRRFAETHRLIGNTKVILFEFAARSGQTFLNADFAADVAREIAARAPDAIIVLSSHMPIATGSRSVIDGSVLSFRENAELTKYCSLLIGCSSGVSWLCTSDWAKRLPMIQLLRRETSVYASFVHDHEFFRLPTDSIIEMTECPAQRIADCAAAVFAEGFDKAKQRFHEKIALDFDFYAKTLSAPLARGRYLDVCRSLLNTVGRYGPRVALMRSLITFFANRIGKVVRNLVARVSRTADPN